MTTARFSAVTARAAAPLLIVFGFALTPAAQGVECNSYELSDRQMSDCAHQVFLAADADLNRAYRVALDMMRSVDATLPPKEAGAAEKVLREAQRGWVRFRDAACTAEGYPYHDGSIRPLVVNNCLARLTRVRTEDLRLIGETN